MVSDTLEVGNYDIKVVAENLPYLSESNWVVCTQPAPPVITIPNVVTPNQDGINESFIIRNLLLYDYRPIVIKNRWGRTVFQSSQYNNDWDGSNVPDGVYYGMVSIIMNNQLVSYPFMVTILHQ